MFTLSANLVEQAAASGTPKALSQALANCAAPLRHRGPIQNAMGSAGYPFGGFPGAHQEPEGIVGGPQVDLKFININIPPWQNIPFTPTPLLDVPPWYGYDFPPLWPSGADFAVGDPRTEQGAQTADSGGRAPPAGPALHVLGDVRLGNTISDDLRARDLTSDNITNNEDLTNRGNAVNDGNMTIRGATTHAGPVRNQGPVTTNGRVTHNGSVNNRATTNNQNVNTYGLQNSAAAVNNYGPVASYSSVNNYGPTSFRKNSYFNQDIYHNATVYNGGDTYTRGDTYLHPDRIFFGIDGGPSFRQLDVRLVSLVTGVTWDGTDLTVTTQDAWIARQLEGSATATSILSGTTCAEEAEEEGEGGES
jgi:hypothetical protein